MYGGASQPGRDSPTPTACVGPVKLCVSSQSCVARHSTGCSELRGKSKREKTKELYTVLRSLPLLKILSPLRKDNQRLCSPVCKLLLCGLPPRGGEEEMHFLEGPIYITASQRGHWAFTSHESAMSRLSCCTAPPGHQQGISRVSMKGNRREWSIGRSLA
ncbi:hypothetical protein ACQKWADRAFT_88012 [Trichoderma austrokoningii]